jgi:hypothetical protein
MKAAKLGVEPLAYDLSISHDHSADQGVRADSTPALVGKRKSPLQEAVIGG